MTKLVKEVKNMAKPNGQRFMRMIKQTIGDTVLQGKFGDNAKKKIADDDIVDLSETQIRKAIQSAIDGPFSSAVMSTLTPWLKSGTRWAA